jgi:hypothetical protein
LAVTAARSRSTHSFKCRLALIIEGHCVLRYDNESGKGDHKHIAHQQFPYQFVSTEQLVKDFWIDVQQIEVKT